MKNTLRKLFRATLDDLDLPTIMAREVRGEADVLRVGELDIDLRAVRRFVVVAIGKAARPMASSFVARLPARECIGLVVAPPGTGDVPAGFQSIVAGHPLPDAESLRAADLAERLLYHLRPTDLVCFLLSGGGSALFEKPIRPEIGLDDCRAFHELLVSCGAGIVEMNTLRKHLSAVKGGRLARLAHPARQLTLYVSDVPPGLPSAVASGPTMPDESLVDDCYEIAERWGLRERFPPSIRRLFDQRALEETPKAGDTTFQSSVWHALLSSDDAARALANRAAAEGWAVEVVEGVDDVPVARAAEQLLARLDAIRVARPDRPAAVITAGELSCPVVGDGIGGRNQAFVLELVPRIAGRDVAVLSAGTDGIDGNSPAAGAVADGETLARGQERGLDPLDHATRSDAHSYFAALEDDILTGPTGNNVRDLRILVSREGPTSEDAAN